MAYREITDPEGRMWRVWDTYPQVSPRERLPTAFRNGWLCFETDTERRRLAPVPLGWQEGTAKEMLAWLRTAEVVRRNGPLDTPRQEAPAVERHPPPPRHVSGSGDPGTATPLRVEEDARAALQQSRATLRRVAEILDTAGDRPEVSDPRER